MFRGYLHASLKNTLKMVVWGCAICHGVGPLVFVAGNVNRAKYIDVLDANRWAVIARYFGGELWPFQDSNASIHRSTENRKQRNDIPRFFSDHPWAQIWTRRKMCGMCWKTPWERAFCRINTDLDFQCAQLFPGIQCLTFSSGLCTSLYQDDASTFSKWRDTSPDIEVIARTLNKN